MTKISVLRIGHRPERDKRITTHVCLTARAFGCKKIYLSKSDSRVIGSVNEVVDKFGGDFIIENISNPERFVKNWSGKVIHLTMFGLPIEDHLEELKNESRDLLIIVGAEKVPSWVFNEADYNICIGNQPHSEVAALAITLNKLDSQAHFKEYGGNLKVIPSATHREMVDNRNFD